MKSAWRMAGLKIGLGSVFVIALIGIRIVTVTPADAEAETLSASTLDGPSNSSSKEAAAQVRDSSPEPVAESEAAGDSLMARLGSGVRDRLPDSGSTTKTTDGTQVVSCHLSGGTQFMTANDCAVRGGRATVFEVDE